MLKCDLTPHHAGIILRGDPWTFDMLESLVRRIDAESEIIWPQYKDGHYFQFARMLNGALHPESMAEIEYAGFGTPNTPMNIPLVSVQVLWPQILFFLGVTRVCMAYIPTDKQDHALVLSLEHAVSQAIERAMPGKSTGLLESAQQVAMYTSVAFEELPSRLNYFVRLRERARLDKLQEIMETLSAGFAQLEAIMEQRKDSGENTDRYGIRKADFDEIKKSGSEIPAFKW